MLDDFFVRALVAGIGLALIAGPLGCFIVWRRMAYFGDTMAHSALLGVALSFLLNIDLMIGVFAVGVLVAISLVLLRRWAGLSTDALLGILSHSSLAVGLVLVALMSWLRVDLMAFLFGDILSVSRTDIALIYLGGACILLVLLRFWQPFLAATVSTELAEAEGQRPEAMRMLIMILMAVVIAIAMKLVGVLLITSLLIIPAATARRFSLTPEQMAVLASMIGAVAVSAGLFGSRQWDTPSGPSIVVAALILFVLSIILPSRLDRERTLGKGGDH